MVNYYLEWHSITKINVRFEYITIPKLGLP